MGEIPTDEELAQLEEELAQIQSGTEENADAYGSPSLKKKDSTLVLFRELIKADKSTKFGNFDTTELGKPRINVRDQLDIAGYFDGEGMEQMGDYFRNKAEITFSTSMSKKGWFGNLIVTQIKKEQKVSKEPSDQVKKNIFGKPKTGGEEQ